MADTLSIPKTKRPTARRTPTGYIYIYIPLQQRVGDGLPNKSCISNERLGHGALDEEENQDMVHDNNHQTQAEVFGSHTFSHKPLMGLMMSVLTNCTNCTKKSSGPIPSPTKPLPSPSCSRMPKAPSTRPAAASPEPESASSQPPT